MTYLKEEVESREEDGSSIGGCGAAGSARILTREIGGWRELLGRPAGFRHIRLEGIQPYFGAGAGAFVITGGGGAMGVFTVNGIAGMALPLGDAFGIYGQVRFLGEVGGGGFVGDLLPGVGLYVNF